MPLDESLSCCVTSGGHSLCDFITVTKLLRNVSHRPIHDLCLSTEAVCVVAICSTLSKPPAHSKLEFKTDTLPYTHLKRNVVPGAIAFRDLHTLRQQDIETPDMRKLYQHAMMTSIAPDETVFSVNRAQERDATS